jgi:ribonuclease E
MAKHILIDSGFGLVRTALTVNGKLVDYYEESPDQGRSKGNIYKGIIKKVDPHIQAAFVRYGSGRDGFLPLRDVPFRSGEESSGKEGGGTRKKAGLGPGDAVVVQVVKDEVGGKGAALTTKLSLSGRYLVYMPDSDGDGGVSSRLSDEERAAMKKALSELRIPDGAAVILRTAALNHPTEELQADLDRLLESHREIEEQAYDRKEPGLLFREAEPAYRYLREYYLPDVERIWVNQDEVLEQCRAFFNLYEPGSAAKVSLSKDGPLMFQRLGVEAEVERLSSRKVTLPSGANFVIDQAEALVAIDVNSAKSGNSRGDANGKEGAGKASRGGDRRARKDLEETVFAINMEAAQEIARQLRLRDLGGIIVVDFIDMEEDRHRRKVEEAMRRTLSHDKAKIKVYDISPLGLMQISRQRLRKAGPLFSKTSCEACQGRGWHASAASASLAVLRRLEDRVQGRGGRSLTVTVPFPVANHLLNDFRSHVLDLEARHGVAVRILADANASGEAVFAAAPSEAPAGGPPKEAAASGERGEREGRKERGRDRGDGRSGRQRQDGQERQERQQGQDGRNRGRDRGVPQPRPDQGPVEDASTEIASREPDGVEAFREEPNLEPAEAGYSSEDSWVSNGEPLAEAEDGHPVDDVPSVVESLGSDPVFAPDTESGAGHAESPRDEAREPSSETGRDKDADARPEAPHRNEGRPGRRGRGRGRHGRGPRQGEGGGTGPNPRDGQPRKEKQGAAAVAVKPPGRQAPATQPVRPAAPVGREPQSGGREPQGGGRRDGKKKGEARPQGRGPEKKPVVRPTGKPPQAKGDAAKAGKAGNKSGRGSRPEAPARAARGPEPKAPRKGPIEY